jgi:hypothetical protein
VGVLSPVSNEHDLRRPPSRPCRYKPIDEESLCYKTTWSRPESNLELTRMRLGRNKIRPSLSSFIARSRRPHSRRSNSRRSRSKRLRSMQGGLPSHFFRHHEICLHRTLSRRCCHGLCAEGTSLFSIDDFFARVRTIDRPNDVRAE